MSRVITFSRVFPSYHPKAGQPTHFVEKVLKSVYKGSQYMTMMDLYSEKIDNTLENFKKGEANPLFKHEPKHHTIRAGHQWKQGDWFSPRVWSGKPYNSKQITFAPDIQIKKEWPFEFLHGRLYLGKNKRQIYTFEELDRIAANDGLSTEDLKAWFRYPKDTSPSQIICWNDEIEY